MGIVAYRAPSYSDGPPIVAVLTGVGRPSRNPKTGPMVQLWIMRSDVEPHVAVKSGADASVCGRWP